MEAFSSLFGLVGYLSLLAAPILGVAALSEIGRSSDVLRGKGFAIAAISVAALVILLGVFASQARRPRSAATRGVCRTNLKGLQIALSNYAREYGGTYPPADKWCDLLVQRCKVTPEQFVCDHAKAIPGESSYAMNRNVGGRKASELPPDMVLLFETKDGWNQSGGAEILTTENHGGGGCNVLFNDGSIKFVRAEEVGELKWRVEDMNQ
jgi:prepilin-type processing-associated H-X9-DG protein